MKINVYGHKTLLTRDVKKYADEKIGKIEQYDKSIIGVDLTLELDERKKLKSAATAKALVKIPGRDISAKAEGQTLLAAIDTLEGKIASQLKKKKDKKVHLKKRLAKGREMVASIWKKGE